MGTLYYSAAAREFTWSAAEVKAKRPEVLPLAGRPLALIEELYAARRLQAPLRKTSRRRRGVDGHTLGHTPYEEPAKTRAGKSAKPSKS